MYRVSRRTIAFVLCLLSSLASGAAHAQLGDTFSPAELVSPKCGDGTYWTFDPTSGNCLAVAETIGKLTSSESCTAAGFEFKSGKCIQGSAKPPEPACTPVSQMSASIKDKKCVYKRNQPSSAPGNFLGDCLGVLSSPKALGLKDRTTYIVTDQKGDGDDKTLTLYEGYVSYFPTLGCKKAGGDEVQVKASAVLATGASRRGYSYGVLTMPYKYFPGEKRFTSGAPIGAYLGWRTGQAGSGWTTAAAFTVGTVTGESVDPKTLDAEGKPTVTGSTQLAALSLAIGVVFDVVKDPKGRPFKAGIFVGKDAVNQSPTTQYAYNRKTWVAVQIGYDFTDN